MPPTAAATLTDRAVMTPLAELPVTVTQVPTVTAAVVTVTVRENVVVDVQLTVSCPVAGFWTSIEAPLSAATVPAAPVGAPLLVETAAAAAAAVAELIANPATTASASRDRHGMHRAI